MGNTTLFRTNGWLICIWSALMLFSFSELRAQENKEIILVSLHVDNQSIISVLDEITDQTGIHFSYNPKIINEKMNVSLSVENENLEHLLSELLPDTVLYEKIGYHIVLYTENREEELGVAEHAEKKISPSDTGLVQNGCHITENIKNQNDMKNLIAAFLLTAFSMGDTLLAQDTLSTDTLSPLSQTQDTVAPPQKVAQLSFVTPLGTSWIHTPQTIFNLSFNIIGGVTGGVHGFEMATVFNINRYEVKGFQMAAGFNICGFDRQWEGSSRNMQLAAGFNYTRKGLSTQLAGGVNVADSGTFQGSAGCNIATKASAQIAGGINLAKRSGFQMAGGVNVADTTGTQLAGGVNVAAKSSCQISIVNVTKRGGFQLGIINVRDTADGVPFGLINVVKKGGVNEFGIEGSEFIHASFTYRSGVRKLYTIWSVGMGFSDLFIAAGAGLGSSVMWKNRIGLNFELAYHQLFELGGNVLYDPDNQSYFDYSDYDRYVALVTFRPVLNIRIVDHFKIFLGPSLNLLVQEVEDNHFLDPPYSFYTEQFTDVKFNFWVGFTGGFKF